MGWFLSFGRNYGRGIIIQGSALLPCHPLGSLGRMRDFSREMYEDLKWRFTWKERSTAVVGSGAGGPAPHAPDLGITVISTRDLSTGPHFQMRQLHSILWPQYGIPTWSGISQRFKAVMQQRGWQWVLTGLIEELTGQPGIAHHFVEGLTKTLHPRNKSAKEKNLLWEKRSLASSWGKSLFAGWCCLWWVPVWGEQLAGREKCWGKRRPAIISPCLAAQVL